VARDQRRRLTWIAATTASYAVDTLFLALFAAAGTIAVAVPALYGIAAAAIGGATYALTASGVNLKARDPSLVEPLVILGIAMQLGVVMAAPQIAFPFLANLFTVFAFAMIWLPLRESVVVWSLGVAAMAVVFLAVGGRIGVPSSSGAELVLVWSYFSVVLARSLLLSVNANEMRNRLAESRRRLAASLEQVRQLASHDDLTGVLNRRALMAALERERVRAERSGAALSIAIMDLDHFKQVNDRHGHAAGDAVLRRFSETVNEAMRATDIFGRYGGEEFLLILVGATAPLAAEAMDRINAAVARIDWSAISPDLSVTLSAGIASYGKGQTVEHMLRRADLALYDAKDAGRNRIMVSKL
jgi:diguanylate cyclase (GGDEF)-like protein